MTSKTGNAEVAQVAGKRAQGIDERRRRLVKAASDLIAEREDGSFSMPELARRAGVSLATPYNLFGSKAAVLAQLFDRQIQGFARSHGWMEGLPPVARMTGMIDRLANAYEKQGRFFRNLWKALYGLDLAGHRALNLSLSNAIVRPLVASLAQDQMVPKTLPLTALETTLVRLFDANFELWAAQDWTSDRLRQELRTGFAFVFLGLLPGDADKELRAIIDETSG
jgi:AcrR family transcriptional regulator